MTSDMGTKLHGYGKLTDPKGNVEEGIFEFNNKYNPNHVLLKEFTEDDWIA